MKTISHLKSAGVAAGVVLAVIATGATPAAAQPAKTGTAALTGIWNTTATVMPIKAGPVAGGSPTYLTADGQAIPLLPAAAKTVAQRLADKTFFTNAEFCSTDGMPTVAFTPPEYPIQVLDGSDQVTVLFSQSRNFRMIRMNEPHPKDPDWSFMGESSGHWQGDALMVDTVALAEEGNILGVIPHSDQLHLVERIRRTGPDTMEDQVTIEDPMIFSKTWTMISRFKRSPETRLAEFHCTPKAAPPDPEVKTAIVAH